MVGAGFPGGSKCHSFSVLLKSYRYRRRLGLFFVGNEIPDSSGFPHGNLGSLLPGCVFCFHSQRLVWRVSNCKTKNTVLVFTVLLHWSWFTGLADLFLPAAETVKVGSVVGMAGKQSLLALPPDGKASKKKPPSTAGTSACRMSCLTFRTVNPAVLFLARLPATQVFAEDEPAYIERVRFRTGTRDLLFPSILDPPGAVHREQGAGGNSRR